MVVCNTCAALIDVMCFCIYQNKGTTFIGLHYSIIFYAYMCNLHCYIIISPMHIHVLTCNTYYWNNIISSCLDIHVELIISSCILMWICTHQAPNHDTTITFRSSINHLLLIHYLLFIMIHLVMCNDHKISSQCGYSKGIYTFTSKNPKQWNKKLEDQGKHVFYNIPLSRSMISLRSVYHCNQLSHYTPKDIYYSIQRQVYIELSLLISYILYDQKWS